MYQRKRSSMDRSTAPSEAACLITGSVYTHKQYTHEYTNDGIIGMSVITVQILLDHVASEILCDRCSELL